MDSLLSVGLFHPPQHAGLSWRTSRHRRHTKLKKFSRAQPERQCRVNNAAELLEFILRSICNVRKRCGCPQHRVVCGQ